MKSKGWLKGVVFAALVGSMVGFAGIYYAKAQDAKTPIKIEKILDVPSKLEGVVGEFIYIESTTQGKTVKFFSLDGGLNIIPAEKLANRKETVVTTGVAGTYRLLCYTVVGEELSDPVVCLVTVKNSNNPPVPPIPPTPNPPEPEPEQGQFLKSLQKAYDSEIQGDKLIILKAYIGQLESAVESINDAKYATVGDIERGIRSQIQIRTLLNVRNAIGEHLRTRIKETEDTKLTPELRGKFGSIYARVVSSLKEIK